MPIVRLDWTFEQSQSKGHIFVKSSRIFSYLSKHLLCPFKILPTSFTPSWLNISSRLFFVLHLIYTSLKWWKYFHYLLCFCTESHTVRHLCNVLTQSSFSLWSVFKLANIKIGFIIYLSWEKRAQNTQPLSHFC